MRQTASVLAASLVIGLGLVTVGCAHNDESACHAVKPGVVTTPNKMCVVMIDDPVNPATEPVVYKGQKYGLCCEGCRGKWNAMSDTQKDAQIAKAMAASK